MLDERVYRYPRYVTWLIELVSGAAVVWGVLGVARAVFLLMWTRWPLDPFLLQRIPPLARLAAWMNRTGPSEPSANALAGPLLWLLAVLLFALIIRNAFPPVRFSVRGLLVGFANDWLPVPREAVRALRISDNANSTRFVVQLQIDSKYLTPWHRVYGAIFRVTPRRSILISSMMNDSEDLLREMLGEITRRRKMGEQLQLKLEEHARSPLFSLLLNPLSLVRGNPGSSNKPVFQPVATAATMGSTAALTMPSMGSAGAPAVPAKPATPPAAALADHVTAHYPQAVQNGLRIATFVIGGFAVWRYLDAWRIFLRYMFPSLADFGIFNLQVSIVSPWNLLIGAHIGLVLLGVLLILVHHLFPTIAVDSQGLVFTVLSRSYRLNWEQVRAVKATDMRNEHHVVLVESDSNALPWFFRMGPWLYDGGVGRGVLIWPLLQPFEPIMQRIALELTRRQQPDQPSRLRDDAPGWLLMLAVRPAHALDQLVEARQGYEDDDMPTGFEWKTVLQCASGMVWNALGPGLLLLIYWMMYQGVLITPKVPATMMFALIWGLAEWPLAALLASSLDQMIGAGNKGYQSLYLYPTAQLPRLIPLTIAILFTLMGFPNLALLIWLGGIAWSGLLTAGLWEALYGWRGFGLLGGSALPVFFQLLTFIGVLVLRG